MEWGVDYFDKDFERELLQERDFLRRFCIKLAGSPDAGEDLAQAALLKALISRHSYTPGTLLRSWIFMIARNKFLTDKRRDWRQVDKRPTISKDGIEGESFFESIPCAENQYKTVLARQALLLVDLLPEGMREAMLLAMEGLTYKEMADLLGVPERSIKSRVLRARSILLHAMGEQGGSHG